MVLIKRWLARYWLLLFLLLVALTLHLQEISLADFFASIAQLSLAELGLVLCTFLVAVVIHVGSRKYALGSMGATSGFGNLFCIHFASLAANYSTPMKIGFPLAVYLLNKLEGVRYSTGTALLMLELVASTWLCALVALVGFPEIFGLPVYLTLLSAAMLVLVSYIGFAAITRLSALLTSEHALLRFVRDLISAVHEINRAPLFAYMLMLLVLRFVDGFFLYLLTGFITEGVGIWQATVAASGSFFVGSVSMVPMGLGTRDAMMFVYLESFGLQDSDAIAIVTLQRILSTGVSFLLGILFAGLLGVRSLEKDAKTSEVDGGRDR